VQRREFEYIRHGTSSFILSRDVASGHLLAPSAGPTRTEADFLAHLQGVIASDPSATRWHVVVDNLDTHRSESLVRKLLKRGSFTSVTDLQQKVFAFITYYNQRAKPFKWTYQGKPLTA
jgi:hypothetical protein